MAYLVLAYPQLTSADFDLVQNFRKENDELYSGVVAPHFTLVFPVFDITSIEFVKERKNQSETLAKFRFTVSHAIIHKDAFKNIFHVFLVPDEGHNDFVKIHDKLYSGLLKGNLRHNIEYVPHIGIGNSSDRFSCEKMIDAWNEMKNSIHGTISNLTIVEYKDNIVTDLEKIELQ